MNKKRNTKPKINTITKARKLLKKALQDPELYYGYQSNIAMLLYDKVARRRGWLHYDVRNDAAKDIIDLFIK